MVRAPAEGTFTFRSKRTSCLSLKVVDDIKGYLVVLRVPVRLARSNPKYRGLYRGPGWPTRFPEEEEALDAYVFGDYMSDSEGGLIPTEQLARELFSRFSASPREFDVIYAQTPHEERPGSPYPLLGYDVACASPFWSILADWPVRQGFESFKGLLNENGLFSDPAHAERFLEQSRRAYPEEDRAILHIWRIHAVYP